MAQGDSRSDGRDLLYVHVDEGVGAGLVSRGNVFRGDTGAAGDIGHIRVTDDPAVVCRCGRTGCLDAVTGGLGPRAQAHRPGRRERRSCPRGWREQGLPDRPGHRAGRHGRATRWPGGGRRPGRGWSAPPSANVVNFVNPGTVVLGGGALRVGTRVFQLFEETVLRRTTQLAAQRLRIRPASLDFREGVTGAAILAIEQLFGPASVGLWIENGSPIGHAAPLQRAVVV